jgi:malonyl CoA-acyl carrier protein transacylase
MRHNAPQSAESEVFLLKGDAKDALAREAEQLRSYLSRQPEVVLADLACTVNSATGKPPLCLSLVASSPEDLEKKLSRAVKRLSDPKTEEIKSKKGIYFSAKPLHHRGKLAFLFPGEGSQYPHMLSDLCIRFPEVRAHFDRIDRAFHACGLARDFVPSEIVFARPEAEAGEGVSKDTGELWRMAGAVAAVLTANQAVLEICNRLDIRPDCLLGHSTGEYTALEAAGLLDVGEGTRYQQYIAELHRIYREATARDVVQKVKLVAAGADAEAVRDCLKGGAGEIHIAMDNCPHQVVFLGPEPAVDKAVKELAARGTICQVLPFDRPYHTPLFRAYAEELRPFFEKWITGSACLPLYSCTTAGPFPDDRAEISNIAVDHWAEPVRFKQTIEAMYRDGIRIFLEVGPRGNLTGFVNDILGERDGLALAANTTVRSGTNQIHHVVGLLAAHGVPLSTDYLYTPRSRSRISVEPEGEDKKQTKDGFESMKIEQELPRLRIGPEARKHRPTPVSDETPKSAESVEAASDEAMEAYFDTMERFLAVQREVMDAYLTGAGELDAATSGQDFSVAFAELEQELPPARLPEEAPAESEGEEATVPSGGTSADSISEILLSRISERTGYPVEMLDPEVDLEADLGIDSIKRIEILGSLWESNPGFKTEDLEKVAAEKTLGAMILSLSGLAATEEAVEPAVRPEAPQLDQEGGNPLEEAVSKLPLIDEILSCSPGRELIASRVFDPERDLFLKDHTIGRRVSMTDPDLTALPVMPLTMSMELMAEAASLLVEDEKVVGMKGFRGHRWILFDGTPLALKMAATREPGSHEVRVRVFSMEQDPSSGDVPFAEGTVLFGAEYPPPPERGGFSLRSERPSRWSPDRLYADKMFHGPRWQGVSSVDRWGEDGSVATLEVLPWDDFFAPPRPGGFLTDPVVLDAAGQIVGFWTMEHLEEGFLVFPYRFEALHLYRQQQDVGRKVTCLARTRLEGSQRVFSDFDLVGEDGKPWMRLEGWEDKRFGLPSRSYGFLLSPVEVIAGEPWVEPFKSFREADALCCLRLDELYRGDDDFWSHVFAHLILNRNERALFRDLNLSGKRSAQWLLERLLAKDAVRTHLKRRYGLILGPADVEIKQEASGRILPDGAWAKEVDSIPLLSLAQTDGLTTAVAGDPEGNLSFGIGIERVRVLEDGVEARAFQPEERALLHSINGSSQEEWLLRSMSAKEAAARALGQDGLEHPESLVVQEVNASAGEVKVALGGKLLEAFPELADRLIRVCTLRRGRHIVASTVLKRSSNDRRNP